MFANEILRSSFSRFPANSRDKVINRCLVLGHILLVSWKDGLKGVFLALHSHILGLFARIELVFLGDGFASLLEVVWPRKRLGIFLRGGI